MKFQDFSKIKKNKKNKKKEKKIEELKMEYFPLEMLCYVFDFVPKAEQPKLSTVSQTWNLAFNEMKKIDKKYWDIVKYANKYKNRDEAMFKAACEGYKDLVIFFLSKGVKSYNQGMYCAAKGGQKDMVDFFISKGACNWTWGLIGGMQGGHCDMVNFFISKGPSNWNGPLFEAARQNRKDWIDLFISKGARDFKWILDKNTKMTEETKRYLEEKQKEYK